jgi:hypothetical protein
MPSKKEQRDYVNPRLLLRGVMKSLPAVEYVRPTVVALWAHSNNFLEKDDVANGTVSFNGTISYGQLADFCGIDYETAKWRMKQLRDKHELVEWERFKLGIRFTFGVRLSGNGLTEVMDYLSEDQRAASGSPAKSSSQVTGRSSQVTEQSSQVMDGLESGNGLPPLAFDLAYLAKTTGSVVDRTSSLRSVDPNQHQGQPQEQPRSRAYQIQEDESPSIPVQSPATQPRVIPPPAAPKEPALTFEEAIAGHDWDGDRVLGCDACTLCGLKAAEIYKKGIIKCVRKELAKSTTANSLLFRVED